MMKRVVSVGALVAGALAVCSCQAVFTFSPVEFLSRDMDKLSTGQKLQRARDVLVAGSEEEVSEAYQTVAALVSEGDTSSETNLLAADLAIAVSGVNEVISGVLENPDIITTGTQEDVEELLATLDVELISAGAGYVQTAAANEDSEISQTQYLVAGAGLMMSAVEESGGFEILETPPEEGDAGYDEYQEATEFITSAGLEDVSDLFSF